MCRHANLWLVLAAFSAGACAHSPTTPTAFTCSTGALRGTYGSQRNGQVSAGTLITSVGLATFDGAGRVVEQLTVSTNGAFSTVSQSGSYTIGSDCAGTLTDASGALTAKLTLVHDGDELLGISVMPGSNVALHFERTPPKCGIASLYGTYGFQRSGQTSAGSLLAVGTVTFDGAGKAVATQTIDRNGTVGPPVTTPATYVVNPDCTASQSDPATGAVFAQMVVVHDDTEALAMSATAGNNVVVHYEKTQ